MKRKIIKLGTATNVISLPARWVAEHKLVAGEEVDVEEAPGKLTITTEKIKKLNTVKVDLRKLGRKLIERYIYAAYTRGYDEIELLYLPTLKEGSDKQIITSEFIQNQVNMLIGVEIIEQVETRCVIKDIGGTYEDEPDPVLRRVFLLLKSFGLDCLKAMKEKDLETLNNISSRHDNIFRFITFYQRMLNRKGYKEPQKTSIMYSLIGKLETVADVYSQISKEAVESNCKYSDKALDVFDIVNASFADFYSLFYSFSDDFALKITDARRKIWQEMNEHFKKGSKEDIKLMGRLAVIVLNTLDLVENRFALQI